MVTYVFNLPFLIIFLAPNVLASTNGMDMSMDGAMDLMSGTMLPYLHFTPGDTLWFQGWVPQSKGAMAGVCIGLFLLAIIDRWLAATRAMAEVAWRNQTETAYANAQKVASGSKLEACEAQSSSPHLSKPPTVARIITLRTSPLFIPAHDVVRGIIHAGQALLMFAFMLAAMTFQASFILSIIIGLGVGETAFGRHISAALLH